MGSHSLSWKFNAKALILESRGLSEADSFHLVYHEGAENPATRAGS